MSDALYWYRNEFERTGRDNDFANTKSLAKRFPMVRAQSEGRKDADKASHERTKSHRWIDRVRDDGTIVFKPSRERESKRWDAKHVFRSYSKFHSNSLYMELEIASNRTLGTRYPRPENEMVLRAIDRRTQLNRRNRRKRY